METSVIDFVPWGLDAAWPSRRWIEPIPGPSADRFKGVRLGHAGNKAMVLTCTLPRDRYDAEVSSTGADPVREIAFDTTYAQINLALHQIRAPGARPDGLIESLVRYASQQANRYRDWPQTQWGVEPACTAGLASWQSGFSLGWRPEFGVNRRAWVPLVVSDVRRSWRQFGRAHAGVAFGAVRYLRSCRTRVRKTRSTARGKMRYARQAQRT